MFYSDRIKTLLVAVCLSIFGMGHADESAVEKLIPPLLTPHTVSENLVYTRPTREGKFNLSKETILTQSGEKTVVHIYGHGGSGAASVFGSVKYAIELFEQDNPDKATPIRVIGSGYMGLTTAIELARRGYRVGITTRSLYALSSWKAEGYFALISLKTTEEEAEAVNEIGMHTFLTYREIEEGNHPYLTSDIVRFLPIYCSKDTVLGVEDLAARGLIPPREVVTLDFGNGITHPDFYKYKTYFIDTTKLMKQLSKEVKRLKIPVNLAEVKSFGAVKETTIFNCTGLGARELNEDNQMIPVRGHLITLKAASGTEHMNYMIYTKVEQDGEDRYLYMFPKTLSVTPQHLKGMACSGVLGGTFIPHADSLSPEESEALNKREFAKMLDRCALFFYGQAYETAQGAAAK